MLRVTAGTQGRDLKRAYLRQVKASPPERDPVGFARVRKAYELLMRLESSASLAPSPVSEPMEDPPTPAPPSTTGEALCEQPSCEQASLRPPTQLAPELEALIARLEEAPETLSDDELEHLSRNPDCNDAVDWELARRGALVTAKRYLERLSSLASRPTSCAPDLALGLRLLLGLEASGKHDLADSVLEGLSPFIDDVSSERATRRTDMLMISLLKELAQLPHEANAVRQIVGRALLEERPEGARAEVDAFAKANPEVGKRVFALLDEKAPLARQMLFGSLLTKSDRRFILRVVIFVLLLVAAWTIDSFPGIVRFLRRVRRFLGRLFAHPT